jgi:hypothetical protein
MGDGPLFSFSLPTSYFLLPTSYFLLPTFFFLLSSLRLRAFAPLRLFLPAFFLPAFFLLRSRVRSNNRRLELLVYNQTLAFSVLGLCCPRTLYPSTSSFLCDS